MLKRLFIFCAFIGIVGCNSSSKSTSVNGEHTTPSGYKYTHVKNGTGTPKEGDFVFFTFKVIGSDGEVLQELMEGPNMPTLQLPTADKPLPEPNPVIEMLSLASVGDSLSLTMPIDSIPSAKSNPKLMNMEYLLYVVEPKDIKDEKAFKVYMEGMRLEQEKAMEEAKAKVPTISAMLSKNINAYKSGKLDVKTTDSGLKYVIHEQGSGVKAKSGMRASVDYFGMTMDGKEFDNSFKRGKPFPFTIGRGMVIKGWDEGIPLLNVGGSATLFIPYQLAYGEAGSPPNIGPKSELAFYVELKDAN